MLISDKTKYADFQGVEKYVTAKSIEAIKRAAEAKFGEMYDLTFADFYACANGDFSRIGEMKDPTVLQVYWCKRFAEFVEDFAKQLKNTVVPMTPEEKTANESLLSVSFGEAILTFLQQWFGLRSYKEAEKITLGELLIAKRAAYNRDMFSRKINEIQRRKFSKK